ncbi:MAG: hypothetical protein A3F18_05225 [Legionellales bacterium RIFCSPHIGHO2_12_FULL_37_14]|nr:MAG: hypothetical protein A3F18_05225 [Legionellales bacterium RIFCSPHIGHO2_12_FULL_37_14]
MQHTVYISDVIDAPVEDVWNILRDFNGLAKFHPGILTSKVENDLLNNAVGSIRHLTFEAGFVREKLLMLDDLLHAFTYSILETTMPVCNYLAGVKLYRVTKSARTFCEWWADFDVIDADKAALAAFIGENVFKVGFEAIGSLCQKISK